MAKSPQLQPGKHTRAECAGSVVFAVYAPIGTDPMLSRHPRAVQPSIKTHPLTQALRDVAACGVNVSALIDLYEDDTWLVEIPAGQPAKETILSTWKQDMSAPQSLAGFLRRMHARFPRSTPVLAIEGHGGAFLPDIDFNRLTPASTTRVTSTTPPTDLHWIGNGGGATFGSGSDPSLPMNSPVLADEFARLADELAGPAGGPSADVDLGARRGTATRGQGVRRPATGADALQQLLQRLGRVAAHREPMDRFRHRIRQLRLLHRGGRLSVGVPVAAVATGQRDRRGAGSPLRRGQPRRDPDAAESAVDRGDGPSPRSHEGHRDSHRQARARACERPARAGARRA